MGRRAGVGAGETRAVLLEAAARVFARRGYDGASISEITSEAGVTSGAVYAHYSSKAELFLATLEAYGDRDLDQLLGRDAPGLADALESIAGNLDRREPIEASLVIAALIAARNDPEVARLLAEQMSTREETFRSVIAEAQAAGSLTPDVSAPAASRLALMIAMGSLMVEVLGLPEIDHREWTAAVERLIGAFRPLG